VAWLGSNHPAFLESLFAVAKAGAALVPINHRLPEGTIFGIFEEADTSAAIIQGSSSHLGLPSSARVVVDGGSGVPGGIDYEALLASASDDEVDESIGFEDLCMIPFTSGTTGTPKGVMLSHGNVTWNVVNLLAFAEFRHDDVTIAIAPFFRVGGTGVNVLPVLFMGGTVVVPTKSEPDELLRLVERHKVTIGFGNPDLLDALAQAPNWPRVDLTSLRFMMTGGAPVPERLIRTFLDRGVTLVQGYGLSEAAPLVLLVDPADAATKVGAAGKPPPLVEVRIVGSDDVDLPPGQTGELLVRGPNVMTGYWRRPEATSAVIDGQGWLRTGDAARLDPEGDIWIVDRVADAYETAGGVVYPGDVERTLISHPAVAEAGVVGVSGTEGTVGAAFIVLFRGAQTTEAELVAYCREMLPEYQIPSSIAFIDELPRSSVGKLMRHALKAAALSRDHLPEPHS
jgi:acyl-CoA synthetase (AMP-forming)/AMP-acid ligase II